MPPSERPPSDGRRDGAPGGDAAPATRANVRAAGLVMLVAFALMAVLNSSGLRSYARDLPEGWLADRLIVAADRWHGLMLAWGPAQLRPAVNDLLERARKAGW